MSAGPEMGASDAPEDDVTASLRRLADVLGDDSMPEELSSVLRGLPLTVDEVGVEHLTVVSDSRHVADRTLVRGATLSDSRLVTMSAPTIDLAVDILPDDLTRRAAIRGVVLPMSGSGPFAVTIGLRRQTSDRHGQFRFDDLAFGSYSGTIEGADPDDRASGDSAEPGVLLARFTLVVD